MMSRAVEASPIRGFCSGIMHTPESLSSYNSSSSSSSSSLDVLLDELKDFHYKYFDVVSVSIIMWWFSLGVSQCFFLFLFFYYVL